MAVTEGTEAQRIAAERAKYVAPAVTAPRLVVAEAEGARITDADGRRFVDFAGGIACQNLGHRHPDVVEAVKEQVDRYLHQCAVVGTYERYIEVCRRLSELSPCGPGEQRSVLVNSGAEAVENAVKIARHATGRPAVVAFENAFHGRTLMAMTLTAKVDPYKKGFGPFASEVYRSAGPYPYRGLSSEAAIEALEDLFRSDVDPEAVSCVILETVQGEGGFIPMPFDFLPRLQELCRKHGILYVADEVQSGVGRTAKMWAVEHYDAVEPDLLVSGKSLGGGLPLAAVTGRADIMDAVHIGGLGGTFGGNPLSCAAAAVVLELVAEPGFLAQAERLGQTMRTRLDAMAGRHADIGEVRGLGPMLAFEFVEQSPERAKAVTAAAFDRGLIVLSCGLYGNVIRLLPPLTITEAELDEGFGILEESLAA
jgi:4-aminobutyrate aminotransferase / (S)-3-amino-2-methylpropionate transaminase / 5-aminovalerate transaminase